VVSFDVPETTLKAMEERSFNQLLCKYSRHVITYLVTLLLENTTIIDMSW